MKAIVQKGYGSIQHLELQDVTKPIPAKGEALVRVRAASLNSWDWDNLKGDQPIVRLLAGLFKPRRKIPGADFAGTVEQLGSGIDTVSVGDSVCGDLCASGWGAFAEYVCVPVSALVPMPSNITFEQAAALPQAGVMALQGICDYADIGRGDKVLINGAGGSFQGLSHEHDAERKRQKLVELYWNRLQVSPRCGL